MDRINWIFVVTAAVYGVLMGLLTGFTAISAMDVMPSSWGWIKLLAGSGASVIGGIFLYSRNPAGAWNVTPGGKP